MPGSKSTKPMARRKRQRMRGLSNRNPPSSATNYSGPIRMPASDTEVIVLKDNATVVCSAGGVISSVYNTNPSGARNWTEYSTSWVEFRVLGIHFTYFPVANAPSTTLLGFSGYQSINHGTVTAPTTLAEASSTGDARGWNAFRNFTREWRMSTPGEALWQPCSGPATVSDTLVLYATGAGVSLTYGDILIQYLVQFKTHAK
jgi:hypothetical protein